MKRSLLLLAICLSFSVVSNAQTRKPVRKTTTPEVKTPAPPSTNGKFKFYYSKEKDGFFNDTDGKDYVVVTAEGKSTSDIKSSLMSTLSSMYSNPSKVISTLGDNIINVTAYVSDVFQYPFASSLKHYSFTYNIKMEIKDGKVKLDTPSFSNILEQEVFMGQTIGTEYLDTKGLYMALFFAKELEQAKVESLINSHITKIVSGLSSNSDW